MATHDTRVVTDSRSDSPSSSGGEKTGGITHVEQIHGKPGISQNHHYDDKDGFRIYGDDEDHDHEPPVMCCETSISYSI